jgi:hypothetical protein
MNKIAKLILIMNKFNTTINFLNYVILSKNGLILRDKYIMVLQCAHWDMRH